MNVFKDQEIPLPETLKLSIFEYALNSTFFHSVVERIIYIYDRQQYELNDHRLQKEEEQTTHNSSTSTNTTTTQDSNEYQPSAYDTGYTPPPTNTYNSNWNDSHQPTAAITYQTYNGISSDQWRQNYDS